MAVMPGGVEDHLDHAFDMPVSWCQGTDLDAKVPGHRRAHSIRMELLSLDLVRFDDIFGQHSQCGLVAQVQTEIVHATRQMSLRLMNLGQ